MRQARCGLLYFALEALIGAAFDVFADISGAGVGALLCNIEERIPAQPAIAAVFMAKALG